jgi:cyclic pyranopterin phosphate synthase
MITDALGRPIKDLRISVTDRCNFRCPYCMPAEVYGDRYRFLPNHEVLTFDEITCVTRILARLGGVKVRLTGGEPLMRSNVPDLVSQLSVVEGIEDLTLTTNGYLLARQAKPLKEAGLKRITVSLDSLDEQVFQKMNGRNFTTAKVLEGITAARAVGFTPVKINVVVQRGVNDHTIVDLARFFRDFGDIVRFIEYMDVGTRNRWTLEQVVPADEILYRIDAAFPLEALPPNYGGEVASRYRYRDGSGEIGIIASVTKPFCGDCTRIRLSADGKIYTCLFASVGHDVKRLLRSGASADEIEKTIMGIWRLRDDRYSEERVSLPAPRPDKVEMYQVGG